MQYAELLTWKGKVQQLILFFSISTSSSGLLSYCVRKGPAKFCRTGTRRPEKKPDQSKIVLGIHSKKVLQRLLKESSLTLDKAITICKAAEEIELQTKEVQSQNKQEGASKFIT